MPSAFCLPSSVVWALCGEFIKKTRPFIAKGRANVSTDFF